jgi:anti-sigma factor RsiW
MSSSENGSAQDRMSAYLDEQLSADEAAAFENYLAERPDVQEELNDLRKVMALVSELPSVETSPEFFDDLSKKLRRRQQAQPDEALMALISLPFQVLSILVILVVATVYMMAQLDQEPQGTLERDPTVSPDEADPKAGSAEPGTRPPSP